MTQTASSSPSFTSWCSRYAGINAPITRLEILSHIAEGTILRLAGGGNERPVTTDGIDDGILSAVVVYRGCRMRLSAHQSPADGRREVDDSGL